MWIHTNLVYSLQEVANTFTRIFGDKHSLTSRKIHKFKLYAAAIIQILGVDRVGNWLCDIHNFTVSLKDPNLFLDESMQQQGSENNWLRHQAKREENAKLEQLVAGEEELTAKQQARLGALQNAKKRKSKCDRLSRQAQCDALRQKRDDAAHV